MADWVVNTMGIIKMDLLDSTVQGMGFLCGVVDHILSEINS